MLLWLLLAILVPVISGVIVFIIFFYGRQIFRSKAVDDGLTNDAAEIMVKDKGFFDSSWNKSASGFMNEYEVQKVGKVVYDRASGLMWQQSGSNVYTDLSGTDEYVSQLNRMDFAGYHDWRLPSLEEAMSLMEPTKNQNSLYIDPKFDEKQQRIVTSDSSLLKDWVVDFNLGRCYISNAYMDDDFKIRYPSYYVRAVR